MIEGRSERAGPRIALHRRSNKIAFQVSPKRFFIVTDRAFLP